MMIDQPSQNITNDAPVEHGESAANDAAARTQTETSTPTVLSYYYDDATGYEIFDPENCDDDEAE